MANNAIAFKKQEVKKLAYNNGWIPTYDKPLKELLGFYSQEHKCHLEVYARSMNVITILKHPSSGYRTLYRNSVGISDLQNIFCDPRTHTGRGFYKKSN